MHTLFSSSQALGRLCGECANYSDWVIAIGPSVIIMVIVVLGMPVLLLVFNPSIVIIICHSFSCHIWYPSLGHHPSLPGTAIGSATMLPDFHILIIVM